MKEMAGTLRRHRALMLNWFAAKGERSSSSSAEGMNTKAKVALKNTTDLRPLKSAKPCYIMSLFASAGSKILWLRQEIQVQLAEETYMHGRTLNFSCSSPTELPQVPQTVFQFAWDRDWLLRLRDRNADQPLVRQSIRW